MAAITNCGSQPALAGRPLWWRWTLATATGELLGFAVPASAGPLAVRILSRLPTAPRALALVPLVALAGVVEGAALGFAQWLVLRRAIRGMAAREWVLPTALAAGIAYILGMTPSTLADLGAGTTAMIGAWILLGPLLLVSLGTAQWLSLRRYVPGAGWWLGAWAAAWMAGLALPFVGLALVPDGSPVAAFIVAGVVSGWLMGAVVGAVSGLALVRLLRSVTSHLSGTCPGWHDG